MVVPSPGMSAYVNVRVQPEGREAVRVITALASGAAERRITVTEALLAAVQVIRAHQDELVTILRMESKPGGNT